jgi:drug/metabolite transporter (DMT)-like permease
MPRREQLPDRRSTRGSVVALIAGAVAIGFAPIFVRLSEVGPSATAFWRVLLAVPPMLLWAYLFHPKTGGHGLLRHSGWRVLTLAGFCFAADLAFWHWSIKLTSVANATLEANLASIFVPVMAWIVLGQKVSRGFVIALAVALAGTALLIGRNVQISASTLRGDALGVITAIFYSGYLLSVKAARDRGFTTGAIMAASGVITAAVLLPVAMLSGEALLPQTSHGWLLLIGLALISHLGGQSLIAYALAGLPASFASVGLLVQPATAALAAWALLGETLAPAQFAGGALLLIGIWLARRDQA